MFTEQDQGPPPHHNRHDWGITLWQIAGSLLFGFIILAICRIIFKLIFFRKYNDYKILNIHPLACIWTTILFTFCGWYFYGHDYGVSNDPIHVFTVKGDIVETREPPPPPKVNPDGFHYKMAARWRIDKKDSPYFTDQYKINVQGERNGINRMFKLECINKDFGYKGENINFGEADWKGDFQWSYVNTYNPVGFWCWLLIGFAFLTFIASVVRIN